jgi:hypothetical protein
LELLEQRFLKQGKKRTLIFKEFIPRGPVRFLVCWSYRIKDQTESCLHHRDFTRKNSNFPLKLPRKWGVEWPLDLRLQTRTKFLHWERKQVYRYGKV